MRATERVRFYRIPRHNVAPYRSRVATPDDQDGPEEPLRLSTQQSRLIRQTWTSSPPARVVGGLDGETRSSSRPSQRQNPSHDSGGPKDSTFTAPPDSIFRHLKNIEKVCRTVDERIQKKKIQKEWSTKMISETARLRKDEVDLEGMRRERARRNGDADRAKLDVTPAAFDSHLRKPQSREEEVVPTSQSLERYLSLSPLSQTAPTGFLDAPCDNDLVDVAVTYVDVVHNECLLTGGFTQPSQASESRVDVADEFPGSDFYSSVSN
jgi:hypothetical protein